VRWSVRLRRGDGGLTDCRLIAGDNGEGPADVYVIGWCAAGATGGIPAVPQGIRCRKLLERPSSRRGVTSVLSTVYLCFLLAVSTFPVTALTEGVSVTLSGRSV